MADYTDTDAEGRLIAPPKVCPMCGWPILLVKIRDYYDVQCTNPAMASSVSGYLFRSCGWSRTASSFSVWLEDDE